MNKILIVNKPKGWTSFDVVAKVRGMIGGVKVGHAGTLDPLATGVLVLLIGKATKKQQELTGLTKEYIAEIKLGQTRDTYDADGDVIDECNFELLTQITEYKITKNQILNELEKFKGQIEQTVPPFSAVHVKGKRLYDLARKGKMENIKLPKRLVNIFEIELLDFFPATKNNLPTLDVRILCSSGTYIRSIAHDLGKKLKVGGYISNLKRTKVGDFDLKDALEIEDIKGQ